MNKEITFCSSCQLGKSKKLPFLENAKIAEKPFELIHMDLWGLALILSNKWCKYYKHFVDDCTRFTCLFRSETKDQVTKIFLDFKAYVERQFDTKIKIVQSNCGIEFMPLENIF